MENQRHQDAVRRANVIPATVGKIVWFYPMLIFWGAVVGPLKPRDYPKVDTAPSLVGFLLGLGGCLVPLWLPRAGSVATDPVRACRRFELLGIRGFKRFVANGDLVNRQVRRHEPGYRMLDGRLALDDLVEATRIRERRHLVLLLMGGASSGYAVGIGWYGWAVVLTMGNVVFNLYPVMLQRYLRARVGRITRGRGGIKARRA